MILVPSYLTNEDISSIYIKIPAYSSDVTINKAKGSAWNREL